MSHLKDQIEVQDYGVVRITVTRPSEILEKIELLRDVKRGLSTANDDYERRALILSKAIQSLEQNFRYDIEETR